MAQAATSKVTAKRDGKDEGTFDRALYFKDTDKYGTTNYTVEIAQNCEKFNCAHFDKSISKQMTSFWTDCPNAKVMEIKLYPEADLKTGAVDIDVYVNGASSGGGLMSGKQKGGTISDASDKEVKGKVDWKEKGGKNEVHGEFVAKNCGTLVVPKEN